LARAKVLLQIAILRENNALWMKDRFQFGFGCVQTPKALSVLHYAGKNLTTPERPFRRRSIYDRLNRRGFNLRRRNGSYDLLNLFRRTAFNSNDLLVLSSARWFRR
jgi:hypothetical protein